MLAGRFFVLGGRFRSRRVAACGWLGFLGGRCCGLGICGRRRLGFGGRGGAVEIGVPAATFENEVALGDQALGLELAAVYTLLDGIFGDALLTLKLFSTPTAKILVGRHGRLVLELVFIFVAWNR